MNQPAIGRSVDDGVVGGGDCGWWCACLVPVALTTMGAYGLVQLFLHWSELMDGGASPSLMYGIVMATVFTIVSSLTRMTWSTSPSGNHTPNAPNCVTISAYAASLAFTIWAWVAFVHDGIRWQDDASAPFVRIKMLLLFVSGAQIIVLSLVAFATLAALCAPRGHPPNQNENRNRDPPSSSSSTQAAYRSYQDNYASNSNNGLTVILDSPGSPDGDTVSVVTHLTCSSDPALESPSPLTSSIHHSPIDSHSNSL